MYKLDLEKAEESVIKLPTSVGSQKKLKNSRKRSTSVSLTMLNALTVWITTNCGKFLKRWSKQTTLPDSEKPVCRSRSNSRTTHGTMDWFQIRKGVRQCCMLSPCLFNLYAGTSCKIQGWMKHKLESRLPGEIWEITPDMKMTSPLWQKAKRN